MAVLQSPPGARLSRDAVSAMTLVNPHVRIDGVDLGADGITAVSGQVLYVARNGMGRVAFGLISDAGKAFTEIGVVKSRRIELHAGRHSVVIECQVDILQGAMAPIYGRWDRAYATEKYLEFGAGDFSR